MQCAARFDSVKPISVLMVADNGTFSGTSEAVFVLDLLQSKNQAPAASVPCQALYTGTLFGEKVLLAISGELRILALIVPVPDWAAHARSKHSTVLSTVRGGDLLQADTHMVAGGPANQCVGALHPSPSWASDGSPRRPRNSSTTIGPCLLQALHQKRPPCLSFAALMQDSTYLGVAFWSVDAAPLARA